MFKLQVMQRLKSSAANVKVELFLNADSIETLDDKKMISHLSLRDKVVSSLTHFLLVFFSVVVVLES